MPTVQFPFGGRILTGEVVDAEPAGDVTGPDATLVVDVDGVTYRTRRSEALPA